MLKNTVVSARMNKKMKVEVFPFELLVPNKDSIAAMLAARRGDLITAGKPSNLLSSLNQDD